MIGLLDAAEHVDAAVKAGRFKLDRKSLLALHNIVAVRELSEPGKFCEDAEDNAPELHRVFDQGLHALQTEVWSPLERSIAFFFLVSLYGFFRMRTSAHLAS